MRPCFKCISSLLLLVSVIRGEPSTIYEKLNSFLAVLPVEKKLSTEESQSLSAFAATLIAKNRAAALPANTIPVLGTSGFSMEKHITYLETQSVSWLCYLLNNTIRPSISSALLCFGPALIVLSLHVLVCERASDRSFTNPSFPQLIT